MKRLLFKQIIIAVMIFFISCSKSDNSGSISSLEKQYNALTNDNANSFFLESALVSKGCAGANCGASFKFNFKNLNYLSDISINIGIFPTPISIWSKYTTEKEIVSSIWRDYNDNQYRLQYTLKNGRVLITGWFSY